MINLYKQLRIWCARWFMKSTVSIFFLICFCCLNWGETSKKKKKFNKKMLIRKSNGGKYVAGACILYVPIQYVTIYQMLACMCSMYRIHKYARTFKVFFHLWILYSFLVVVIDLKQLTWRIRHTFFSLVMHIE